MRRRPPSLSLPVITLIAAILAAAMPSVAAPPVLVSGVASCGGGLAPGPDSALSGTIGQPVAGFAATNRALHWSGFWAGEIATPSLVTVAGLKTAADGSYVCLSGPVASSDRDDLGAYFYAQAPDRSSGVRITPLNGMIAGLNRGSRVTAVGTVRTMTSGERELSAPSVTVTGNSPAPTALTMANRSVGGRDSGSPPAYGQYGVAGGYGLNNVGLLVRTAGVVLARGKGYFTITDGSPEPVRVFSALLVSVPAVGTRVVVTGISSIWYDGESRQRYILPRDGEDVTAL